MGAFFEDITKGMSDYALKRLLPAVVLFLVGVLLVKVVLKIVSAVLSKGKLEKAAHSLIKSAIKILLGVLLGLIVASCLGIDVTGVVALASVLTLAISLSLQDLLTNIFGGFTLLYTHPFASGDYVEIAGQSGSVVEIGLAYTKLYTPDNKQVSIPNSAVVSSEIVNYTANGTRRAEIIVRAPYDCPIDEVLGALSEAVNLETIEKDPAPFMAVYRYGENAVEYVLRFWSANDTYWDNYFAINKRIKEIFDARGISMPYPQLNVHLDK